MKIPQVFTLIRNMFKDSSKKYPLYLPQNGVYLHLFCINKKANTNCIGLMLLDFS